MKKPKTIAKALFKGLIKSEQSGTYEPEAIVEIDEWIFYAIKMSNEDHPFVSIIINERHTFSNTTTEVEDELFDMWENRKH